MLTRERMVTACEVLDALRDMNIDQCDNALSEENFSLAGTLANDMLVLGAALDILDKHMPKYDPMEIPAFLRRQAE